MLIVSAKFRGSTGTIQADGVSSPLLEGSKKKKRRGPSKCNTLWVAKAPKFLKYIFYSGKELTSVQTHLWACIIGIIVGVVVVAYEKALHGGVFVIWHLLFLKIQETGIFSERFPAYNYNWMVATVLGILTGKYCYFVYTHF